ncbi:MAG: response regulator [Polaromonas sp.]|uniref:response regulator n=1 Tax=Polaromonas sp. TaxID=1869339 RepID=UPI002719945A|nr:response regulator [Polaromonas sp.]MDO9114323.1 response regulator [Polaromonas sp.]MDP1886591.1 response regulator [Polaromonas sp.]
MKRIFVKFFGFSGTERQALDLVFRLSESRDVVYSAWTSQTAEAMEAPDVLIIDGDSWEAVLALANPVHDGLKLIWIGGDAPAQAWRVFPAPVKWSGVLDAMDEAYGLLPLPSSPEARASSPIDLDLAHDEDLDVVLDQGDATEPLPLEPGALPLVGRRVLVVDPGRDDRLYLRAKLAAAGLHEVDEAATGTEALILLNTHAYLLVTVDLGLTDMDPWQLVKAVDNTRPAIAHMFVTGTAPAWQQGLRARFSGAQVYLRKPLHPGQLKKLLRNI